MNMMMICLTGVLPTPREKTDPTGAMLVCRRRGGREGGFGGKAPALLFPQRRTIRPVVCSFATAAVACLAVSAAAASAVGTYVEETLDNGLRVAYIQHRANPMVASSVVVNAGVIHEPEGMNGASHFLEHLLFNGTERRTQRELYDEADRYGAYNNASTREDHTLFSLLIQKEFAEKGLDIQSDMLFHSTLPQEKFDKEKGIVLEEMAKDANDPESLAREGFRAFAYAGTPLSRPVLGSEASISTLSRDAVYRYYKSRYVPSNMMLVLMGDFELSEMKAAVRRTFGSAAAAKRPAASQGKWPTTPANNLLRHLVEAGRTYVHAAFPLPLPPQHPDVAAIELLIDALSDTDEAPLRRALTSGADPLALSFSLAVSPRVAPWSTVEFEAVLPASRDASEVLATLADALGSPEVLQAARDRVDAVRYAARADEVLTADQIHYYVLTRSAYVPDSPKDYLARRLEILDAVSEEALDRAASFLRDGVSAIRVAVAGPGQAESRSSWKSPVRSAARAAAESSDAARAIDETLPTGIRLHLERNDDSKVFAVHLALAPRTASEPAGKEGIADFVHRLLLRGTLVHDRVALAARLQDLGARVKTHDDPAVPYDDYQTTPEYSFVRLEMPADRWREGIATLGEIVRFPRFDPKEIESVRKEMLDLQKRRSESTRARAQDLAASVLAPDHPLSKPVLGTNASVSSISAEDLRTFHAAYVTGRRMVLTQVGPVEPREVLDAVAGAFSDLAPGQEPAAVPKPPLTPPGRAAEDKLGKEQASVAVAYLFDADAGDEAALQVAGALLADILSFRLREEKGLAYSMSASIGGWGGRTRFEASMATRQANVDEAVRGLSDEIGAFREAEPDPAAVERAANSLRGRLLMRRLTRINQAYFAGLDRIAQRPAGDDLSRLRALLEVRAPDVRRVVRKYLDPAKCATLIVR